MNTGLLIVLGTVALYCVYVLGFRHGMVLMHNSWLNWLNGAVSFQKRTSVADLYPEKRND